MSVFGIGLSYGLATLLAMFSGVSIAAFCALTVTGISFVRLLDLIERHCMRIAMRRAKPGTVVLGPEGPAADASRELRPARPPVTLRGGLSDR